MMTATNKLCWEKKNCNKNEVTRNGTQKWCYDVWRKRKLLWSFCIDIWLATASHKTELHTLCAICDMIRYVFHSISFYLIIHFSFHWVFNQTHTRYRYRITRHHDSSTTNASQTSKHSRFHSIVRISFIHVSSIAVKGSRFVLLHT